ncbi:hypothetical protein [Nostoc sp.]|uniref:hypothetical protein n=1 Tax=Nostoc sp. TaxID=1180 RepID=UPI002FFB4775
MAGLYDICVITVDTQQYAFRAAKGFYVGAVATATGISVADSDAELKLPLIPVKELMRAGVLKTSTINAKLGTKRYKAKVHYTLAKAATVETALKATKIPTVAGKASSGADIDGFSDSLRVTGRS